jgi:acetyl-CoA carboxylase carboxyl transferase subunit alpha
MSSSAWHTVHLARHPDRPHTLDYLRALCCGFQELHGDRRFGDDAALVGGVAQFAGRGVVVLGHQKGRNTHENIVRRFGMPQAEGYRKALRLMRHAERFRLPLLCFIDTPGAYPGVESEERGQATAIAESILAMVELQTPSIAVIIGEGGSGGALAIGAADRVLMLEHAIYSVASPEACASILWHDTSRAAQAAESLKITAEDLLRFQVIDEIITEPLGGAHCEPHQVMRNVHTALLRHLTELEHISNGGPDTLAKLVQARQARFRRIGMWEQ